LIQKYATPDYERHNRHDETSGEATSLDTVCNRKRHAPDSTHCDIGCIVTRRLISRDSKGATLLSLTRQCFGCNLLAIPKHVGTHRAVNLTVCGLLRTLIYSLTREEVYHRGLRVSRSVACNEKGVRHIDPSLKFYKRICGVDRP
jgi:hypothetical protein